MAVKLTIECFYITSHILGTNEELISISSIEIKALWLFNTATSSKTVNNRISVGAVCYKQWQDIIRALFLCVAVQTHMSIDFSGVLRHVDCLFASCPLMRLLIRSF